MGEEWRMAIRSGIEALKIRLYIIPGELVLETLIPSNRSALRALLGAAMKRGFRLILCSDASSKLMEFPGFERPAGNPSGVPALAPELM